MENNKKNEELQSRREFFKKAAKGALPILGAIVLANAPVIAKAAEEPMGCKYGCSSGCEGACSGTCHYGCKQSCYHDCTKTCAGGCKTGCKHSCTKTCGATCKGGNYGY